MYSTSRCMDIREFVDDFCEDHPEYVCKSYSIIPLCHFPKFGMELSHLYITRNNSTNKLKLWMGSFDNDLLPHLHRYGHWCDLYYVEKFDEYVALHNSEVRQMFSFEFDNINILFDYSGQLDSHHAYMAFLIENDGKTAFYLFDNDKPSHPIWYDRIITIENNLILATKGSISYILNAIGQSVCCIGEYRMIKLISNFLFLAELNGNKCIRNFEGKTIAPIVKGQFQRLTDEYHYLSKEFDKFSIYDFYGNKSSDDYDSIKNSNNKYLFTQREDKYYLLDLSGRVIEESTDFMTICREFWKN